MAKEINDLAPVLLAIGRQIADQKATPARSERPERDLPILLIPNQVRGLTGTDRRKDEARLPYLLGATPASAPVPPEPAGPMPPPLKPPRNEGPYPRINPDLLGGQPA